MVYSSGSNVTVINNFTIPISDLAVGNYTLSVTTIPDDDHYSVTGTYKITVIKERSTLTVDDIVFDYNSEGSGNVSYTGATGVTAIVVGQPKAVVSVSGNKINVSGLAAGNYTLNVTTVPDENHSAVTKTATITVNKLNSSLTVDNIELDYGDSINVTVTTDGATGITAKIDDVNVTVKGYTIPISGLGAGNYTLTVTTIADENHTSVTETANITVNKLSTSIIIANETLDLKVGDMSTISANLIPADAGNLTFTSSDNNVVTVDANGNVKAVGEGTANITVRFLGNDNYTASQAIITVNVTLIEPGMKVSVPDVNVGDEVNATVTLPEDATGDVVIKLDGNDIATVQANGTVIVSLGNFTESNHTVEVAYSGDYKYLSSTKSVSFDVTKIDTIITVDSKVTRVATDYYACERGDFIYAVLKDVDGNVLANKTVYVAVNGKTYEVITDEEGKAGVRINLANANTYTYVIQFQGDDKYNAAPMASCKLTVTKKTTSISASAKTFKASAKTKSYSVTLKTSKTHMMAKPI